MENVNLLKDCFKQDNFEKLLLVNWTQFLDSAKILKFITDNAQKNINRFANISVNQIKPKGTSITISRFDLSKSGFIIWIDFYVPLTTKSYCEGTTEIFLPCDGNITHINTTGNIFSV